MTPPRKRKRTPSSARILPVCLPEAHPGGVGLTICAERIAVPGCMPGKDLFVIRMEDDGMAPTIRRGAFLGLDRSDKRVRSGAIYGIMVPLEGLVVKRVVVDQEKRLAVLTDTRTTQPPYRLTPEEFRMRVVGKVVWVFQEF